MPKSTATERNALVAPEWVGDAILSLPLIEQLSKEYEAVDVLAVPAVEAVYQCCPYVRTLRVEHFKHGKLQLGLRIKIANAIRGRYQTAIICPNSLKSALIAWIAAIPARRGTTGESRYWVINERRDPVLRGPGKRPSMLQTYLGFADKPLCASEIDGLGIHRPVLKISGAAPDTARLVLCPGAEYGPAKQWPTEYFAQVARYWLNENPKHSVVIVGGPKDSALGAEIESAIARNMPAQRHAVKNLCGKTSLLEAFGEIANAGCVISNDSGLMHAAAALDITVIALFGSTDPHHTPPHSPKAVVLSLGLACSPCFQRKCPLGTTACLKELTPERVISALGHVRAARL